MINKAPSIRLENKNKPVNPIYLTGFCLILTLPLLSLPPLLDPPDWGKTIVFRIIISFLALFFGYQILFKKISVNFCLNWQKPIIISLIALFLACGLSTALSVDLHNSLWGDPYRAGGMMNLIFLFLYTVLIYLLTDRGSFLAILKTAVFTGLIVATIGLFQRFGIFPAIFQKTIINIASTIGGPNFLSLYLMILLFVAIYLSIQEIRKNIRVVYGAIILIFLVTIFFCISQATYLGLAAGAAYLLLFFPKKNRWLSIARIAAMVGVLAVIGATAYLKANSDNPLSKVALFSWHIDNSRLSAWRVSWEAIKNRPVFGYGPENFSIAFNRYYDPELPDIQMDPDYKFSWWDKPHNIFIEVAVNSGVVGLIAYSLFFGLLIWRLLTTRTANNDRTNGDNVLISHFFVAIFIAYFTNLFFAFDTFSSSLLIFTIIAFSLRIINRQSDESLILTNKSTANASAKTKAIFIVLIIITGWFIYRHNLMPLIANGEMNTAQKMATRGDCLKAIDLASASVQRNTIIGGYLRLKSVEILKCGLTSDNNEVARTNRINQIIAASKESAEASPQNPKAWLYLSEFTALLIDKETDPIIKDDLLDAVNGYLNFAEELSPKRQEIVIDRAKANISAGKYLEALQIANKCRDLNTDLGECYWLMAVSQIYLGVDKTQIINNLRLAEDRGYDAGSTAALTILVNAYIATNNFLALVEPLQKLINLNPAIGDYHGQLAAVYKELGEYQKAKEEALKLLEMDPTAKEEVDNFIESLPRQ